MPASKRIQLLLNEDSPDDAELLVMALERDGLACDPLRTDRLAQFEAALDARAWDVIVSDYKLAGYTAHDALGAYTRRLLDTPFIVVSGEIGEETAVELMKAGAHDFFLKDHLARLGTAIQREMREAAIRRERRDTLARLHESELRFRTLADAAPVMIWATEATLARTYFNRPWLDFRGRTLEQEAGTGWLEGVHLEDRNRVHAALAKLSAHGSHQVEFRLRRSDGEYRWILERAAPRYESAAGFAGYVGSSVDITPLKQTEESLKMALQARDEFLSAASHELRTPLTALALHLDLLQRRLTGADHAELAANIAKADRQITRLTKLVNTMLDIARMTAGELKLSLGKVDLSELVRTVIDDLHETVAPTGSQITLKTTGPVVGCWDAVQLTSVIGNLVTNAAKYGQGKPIEVGVELRDSTAWLTVADHGIGIPFESQERIFQRFARGVAERVYSGMGIGLWIVHQVVEAHGGLIKLTSAPGKGSTFEIGLPLGPSGK